VRGLFVGRFQPFHRGHLEVVRALRAARPEERILIVVGTAELSYTPENPFTAGERIEMAARALAAAQLDGVELVPVADIHRHSLWVAYLEGLLPKFERVYTNNPLTRMLFEARGYAVESPAWVDRAHLEGTVIRRAMAEGTAWRPYVPEAVAEYLDEIRASERVRLLLGTGAHAPGRS
jgi:nicotinamide-nucleotide adenylyltransferase